MILSIALLERFRIGDGTGADDARSVMLGEIFVEGGIQYWLVAVATPEQQETRDTRQPPRNP